MKNHKKIAIFGSYNGTSIGDTAILLGFLSSLERVYGENIEVNVMLMKHIDIKKECLSLGIKLNIKKIVITEFEKSTNLLSSFTFLYKKFVNKFLYKRVVKLQTLHNALKDVDYLLIGGGNLIMDLYPKGPKLIQQICDAAIFQKVKYSFIGVGAGPIDTKYGKEVLKKSLLHAEYVFLRDQKSLNLVQDIYKEIKFSLMPDLAFGLNKAQGSLVDRDTLLVNVASVYAEGWPIKDADKFKHYIHHLIEVTKDLVNSKKFKKVILFYSNYPLDTIGGKAYMNELKQENISIEVIDRALSVSEIISLANSAKLTLVTRLHAGIMAYHGGSPIAAVSYQPKVKDILQENGISNHIYDIEFKNREKITKQIIDSINIKTKRKNKINREDIDKILIEVLDAK